MSSLPPGLEIYQNYINKQEERDLIRGVKNGEWLTQLKRRVQHYGYPYNYKSRGVGSALPGGLPEWSDGLMEKMLNDQLIYSPMEQLIVNEYEPGQGIGRHVDSKDFGNTIISMSLGSSCVMIFRDSGGKMIEVVLKPRTLLIMRDDARLKWSHEIPSRKSDHGVKRGLRISLTFRYLAENDPLII